MNEREKHDLGGFASSGDDKGKPAGDASGNPASAGTDDSPERTGKRDDDQDDDKPVDLATFGRGTERDELVAGARPRAVPESPGRTASDEFVPESPASAPPGKAVPGPPPSMPPAAGMPPGRLPQQPGAETAPGAPGAGTPVRTAPGGPVETTPEQAEYDRRHGDAPEEFEPLFSEAHVKELKERWHDIQVGFVDDPAVAVRRARELNDELVTSLAAALDARKLALQRATADGDTEGLRQALRHYRHILDRIAAL